MGWLWNTPKPAVSARHDIPKTMTDSATQDSPPEPQVAVPVKQTLSRDEQANAELMELVKEFQQDADIERGARVQSRQSGVLSYLEPLPDDISPDSLYPQKMDCRSAFDYAMFCQSFGGQFVNIYRYGSFRSCSSHWDDFFLCMRVRKWDEAEKSKVVKDHYRQKAVMYKTGPSSEDIWQMRTEPVKDAFQDSLEELEARIEHWKKENPNSTDPYPSYRSP